MLYEIVHQQALPLKAQYAECISLFHCNLTNKIFYHSMDLCTYQPFYSCDQMAYHPIFYTIFAAHRRI